MSRTRRPEGDTIEQELRLGACDLAAAWGRVVPPERARVLIDRVVKLGPHGPPEVQP